MLLLSSQPELDRDFDDHVNCHTLTLCRRKTPLPYRLHGAIVEPAGQTSQDADVADAAVATHDDLQDDLAGHAALPGVFGVVGADFLQ
jgi:hypothetical protein